MDLYARSAPYYDLIYGPIVNYERETDLLERIFADHAARPVHKVLDLGCGTGNHSTLLAERGYEVLGLDRNEAFIRIAQKKARALDRPPRFVVGDMRDLGDVGHFDALISMFGAFGHVARADARETLRGFRKALHPGGVLAFEWWNESGARDGHQ
ncbi:MAG: class I SAM-dependent DNA methyltransferase, partial [Thermoplasmata archaeon]